MMIPKATMATALLASVALASPTRRNPLISKRLTDGEDCTGDEVGETRTGIFFAVNSEGYTVPCDEAQEYASAANGYACYTTTDDDNLGQSAKCPNDPPPSKNPDGSDVSIAESIIDTWCKNAAEPAFINIPACFVFGYYEAHGDPIKEAESGAVGVCDTIFSGACTWFTSVAPEIAEGMSRPCVDDPGSNACAFANPGK